MEDRKPSEESSAKLTAEGTADGLGNQWRVKGGENEVRGARKLKFDPPLPEKRRNFPK